MTIESLDPFNFQVPEKTTNSICTRTFAIFLIGIFVTIPLAEIDNSSFDYNEVYISFGHQGCLHLECNLISCK